MGDAIYRSSRGLPLIYNGDPPGAPVLTMECYCKWYAAYSVHPDGSVREHEIELWDHVPPPEALVELKLILGFEWDEPTLDMVAGRWVRERPGLNLNPFKGLDLGC